MIKEELLEVASIINEALESKFKFTDEKALEVADVLVNKLGYRKQVWHKVAEGDLPTEPGTYYIAYRQSPLNWNMYDVTFYAAHSDEKYKWIGHLDDVIAWAEELPKYEDE